MSQQNHERLLAAATALRQAREQRQAIKKISVSHGINGLDEAYAVAQINTEFRVQHGARIIGKKIGLTSNAVQVQLGVDQPDFGILFGDMEFSDQASIDCAQFIQPKIEAEIAFILGQDLPENLSRFEDLIPCISHAVAVLEIVDSVIEDWKINIEDTVADNASSAAFVLGYTKIPFENMNFTDLEMTLYKNDQLVSSGNLQDIIHPLEAAWWLAKEMNKRQQPLKKGEIILSGALGPMVSIQAGDFIAAEITGLGKVSCHFL